MEKEVTVKDIIQAVKGGVNYLLTKWLSLLIFGVIGGVTGVVYAMLTTPVYTASLNFILSNNSQSGGLMSIANQFGVDFSTGRNDVFSGDNIIALMKSRRMVQQALLIKPDNSSQSLLNRYCLKNNLNKSWINVPRFKNVYPFPDSLSKWTPLQDSMFRQIYKLVQEKNLDVAKPEKDQSIYIVSTTSKDELFSYYLTRRIVDVTSSFYISAKTKVAAGNLSMLQHEADSLRRLLGSAITSAASENDETFNLNPAFQVRRSSSQQSQAQVTVVGAAYGEVVKNLELAKITLQKETPLYQIIDEPSLPLEIQKPGKLTSLIIGGFISGFLACLVLLLVRAYKSFI